MRSLGSISHILRAKNHELASRSWAVAETYILQDAGKTPEMVQYDRASLGLYPCFTEIFGNTERDGPRVKYLYNKTISQLRRVSFDSRFTHIKSVPVSVTWLIVADLSSINMFFNHKAVFLAVLASG